MAKARDCLKSIVHFGKVNIFLECRSLQRLRKKDCHKFEGSLVYIAKPCVKNKQTKKTKYLT